MTDIDLDEDDALLAELDDMLADETDLPPVVITQSVAPPAPVRAPKKTGEPRPIMSGHCRFPQAQDPHLSHGRCIGMYQGHPCPCSCHLAHEYFDNITESQPEMNRDGTFGEVEVYECGGCGGEIAEAPVYGTDADGDPIYVHVDHERLMMHVECRT